MTTIFDGKRFAWKLEGQLRTQVAKLIKLGIRPKLVSLLVGSDPASVLYTNLKKHKAESVGIQMAVRSGKWKTDKEIIEEIEILNKNVSVHGIMVQLPLPDALKADTQAILNAIAPKKDVDGLGQESHFVQATVRAVLVILVEAQAIPKKHSVVVVGADGMVGKGIFHQLTLKGFTVHGVDVENHTPAPITQNADVLISATGHPALIKANMVKDGAIVIDVGSPKGDVDFLPVSRKTSFITPVPGGVGPVTIVSLLENLVQAAKSSPSW